MNYGIGKFSRIVNISVDTLRYYEKEGLIVPKRDNVNRRQYTDHDVKWIDFIKRLKKTGMPIKDIKKYAKLRYRGNETINDRLKLLYDQRHRLKADQVELQGHINFLDEKIQTYHEMNASVEAKLESK
ncbi:MerR family transcriptional regulator [Lentilactobacillus sp. IMAU92037]|uniref:MerR family transcriptional regulator n=2 Tax=Lentilactobacillus dabitei TaxID=2831523 RepID=UPI001C2BF431|nr:MerR family transcriptional regulator [Lentilactobacillus dabitei]MBV0931545.1 MerR family transcriptional regulator [Lentilactobacillus dabitei]